MTGATLPLDEGDLSIHERPFVFQEHVDEVMLIGGKDVCKHLRGFSCFKEKAHAVSVQYHPLVLLLELILTDECRVFQPGMSLFVSIVCHDIRKVWASEQIPIEYTKTGDRDA